MQDAKNRQKFAICAPSHNFVGLYLRNWGTYRQLENNLLSSNIVSRCLHNMVNFGPLAAEIGPVVWGTPANFNGFHVLAALRHGKLCGVERRAPPIFGRAAITLGIGPHHSFCGFSICLQHFAVDVYINCSFYINICFFIISVLGLFSSCCNKNTGVSKNRIDKKLNCLKMQNAYRRLSLRCSVQRICSHRYSARSTLL